METRSKLVLQVFSILHYITLRNKMKIIIGIVSVFIVFVMGSCEKSPVNESLLTGRWSIINDSTLLLGVGPLQTNIHSNFIGGLADDYDFTSEGNLYIREGTNFDTLAYTFVSTNRINIIAFSYNGTRFPGGAGMGTFTIEGLTGNNVTLGLSELTPDGKEIRIINLKRYEYIY